MVTSDEQQRADDQQLVEELLDIEEGLTNWEVDFSESLDRWLKMYDVLSEGAQKEHHKVLTPGQRRKAESILDEWQEKHQT